MTCHEKNPIKKLSKIIKKIPPVHKTKSHPFEGESFFNKKKNHKIKVYIWLSKRKKYLSLTLYLCARFH